MSDVEPIYLVAALFVFAAGLPLGLIAFAMLAIARRRPAMTWPRGLVWLNWTAVAVHVANLYVHGWLVGELLYNGRFQFFNWGSQFVLGSIVASAGAIPAWIALASRAPERVAQVSPGGV